MSARPTHINIAIFAAKEDYMMPFIYALSEKPKIFESAGYYRTEIEMEIMQAPCRVQFIPYDANLFDSMVLGYHAVIALCGNRNDLELASAVSSISSDTTKTYVLDATVDSDFPYHRIKGFAGAMWRYRPTREDNLRSILLPIIVMSIRPTLAMAQDGCAIDSAQAVVDANIPAGKATPPSDSPLVPQKMRTVINTDTREITVGDNVIALKGSGPVTIMIGTVALAL